MSDPFKLNDMTSGKSAEVARQLAVKRMGAGFVFGHEAPKRDIAMSAKGPVALPWSTGKPLGTQMEAYGGIERTYDADGQVLSTKLTFDLDPKEASKLKKGSLEAETIESVNAGLRIPSTTHFDEGDFYAGSSPEGERCAGLEEGTGLQCIMYAEHWGPCHFEHDWDRGPFSHEKS